MVWQDAWTGPEQGAAPTSTPPWRVAAVQPRSSRRTASVPPWVVAVVVVLCGVAALSLLQRTTAARPGPPEATSRLLPPVTTTAQGPYSVIATRADGQPVRWSPCRPIHWVYRPEGEPKYGRSTVLEAVAAVEAATGLSFVYDGDTTEVPSVDRPAQIPELYPGRYAPVLVAWATPEQVARFRSDGDAIGLARPHTAYGEHGGEEIVSAWAYMSTAGPLFTRQGTVLHELGHVVGLGHVSASKQMMRDYTTGMSAFGTGDLQGLALMGQGPCHGD